MATKTLSARRHVTTPRSRGAGNAQPTKKSTVRVLSVALDALELLSKTARGIGVRELARALGVGKSTMHRILQTLEVRSLVRQDRDTARYVVTARLMEIASSVRENLEFRRVAHAHLQALQRSAGETVFLGVLDGGEVVIVDRIDSSEPLRMVSQIGFREPAHSTALGKTLLANLPEGEGVRILSNMELKRFTPNTTTSVEALKADLNRIRLSGFAIDDEETLPGVRCVAAPIRDTSGQVIAAVSVSGPSVRVTRERIPPLAQDVRATAEMVSRELGYRGDLPVSGAARQSIASLGAGSGETRETI